MPNIRELLREAPPEPLANIEALPPALPSFDQDSTYGTTRSRDFERAYVQQQLVAPPKGERNPSPRHNIPTFGEDSIGGVNEQTIAGEGQIFKTDEKGRSAVADKIYGSADTGGGYIKDASGVMAVLNPSEPGIKVESRGVKQARFAAAQAQLNHAQEGQVMRMKLTQLGETEAKLNAARKAYPSGTRLRDLRAYIKQYEGGLGGIPSIQERMANGERPSKADALRLREYQTMKESMSKIEQIEAGLESIDQERRIVQDSMRVYTGMPAPPTPDEAAAAQKIREMMDEEARQEHETAKAEKESKAKTGMEESKRKAEITQLKQMRAQIVNTLKDSGYAERRENIEKEFGGNPDESDRKERAAALKALDAEMPEASLRAKQLEKINRALDVRLGLAESELTRVEMKAIELLVKKGLPKEVAIKRIMAKREDKATGNVQTVR